MPIKLANWYQQISQPGPRTLPLHWHASPPDNNSAPTHSLSTAGGLPSPQRDARQYLFNRSKAADVIFLMRR